MVFTIILLILSIFFIFGGVVAFIDTEQKDKKWHKEHYGEFPPWSHVTDGAMGWTIGTVLIIFGLAFIIVFVLPRFIN